MYEAFISRSFYAASMTIIKQAQEIGQEYLAKGFALTLRQLYYQFVARDLLKNTVNNYKRLGSIINDARLAGLIDWDLIEDRTRWLRQIPDWETPYDWMRQTHRGYAEYLWRGQDVYAEVWVEKDALSGVIARACNEWRVPYFPCRGYASQSELYEAGRRMASKMGEHKTAVVFHLGDHDPSGIDMTRDNADRLELFSGMSVEVHRLALNMDQVEEFNPPPNPAKETDSRFADYEEKFGSESWELDAVKPDVIHELVYSAIQGVVDEELFNERHEHEKIQRATLLKIANNWTSVIDHLSTI